MNLMTQALVVYKFDKSFMSFLSKSSSPGNFKHKF